MKKKIIITILCIILTLFTFSITTYATTIDPNRYQPTTETIPTELTNKAGIIVSVIRTIGIVVMVVSLMILGIKYMVGSVEEKADYKKTMIPYLIGATLFFALSQVLSVIISIANNIN